MEFTLELGFNVLLAIFTYLLGMAFAGSFLGRRWMGTVDVFLHKVLKMEVTIGKYLYWKHFCNVPDPPKPEQMQRPTGLAGMLFTRFLG
ncbi:MAG: hypothetical protein NWE89_01835 [Candidatus Bathyarchaeota archaeon]|nr:hypothetical protein [Candidatus Bathyarchaeota archaeon]